MLKNLEALIDAHGEISIGRIGSIPCAVTASDDDQTYAMLLRRRSESLLQLLERLDTTLAWAWEHEEMVDEINAPRETPERSERDRAPEPTRRRVKRLHRGAHSGGSYVRAARHPVPIHPDAPARTAQERPVAKAPQSLLQRQRQDIIVLLQLLGEPLEPLPTSVTIL